LRGCPSAGRRGGMCRRSLHYGSLYNHSASPCARYHKVFDADVIDFVAVRNVEPGCEITVDYTDGGNNELWFPLCCAPPGGGWPATTY
jgi:SET domain-containing protein